MISVKASSISLKHLTWDYQERHTEDDVMVCKECAYVTLCARKNRRGRTPERRIRSLLRYIWRNSSSVERPWQTGSVIRTKQRAEYVLTNWNVIFIPFHHKDTSPLSLKKRTIWRPTPIGDITAGVAVDIGIAVSVVDAVSLLAEI